MSFFYFIFFHFYSALKSSQIMVLISLAKQAFQSYSGVWVIVAARLADLFLGEIKWLLLAGLVCYAIYKLDRPTAHLQGTGIPHVSLFKFAWMMINGTPTYDISEQLSMPLLKDPNCHMYARFERLGWSIHVATPQAAKAVFMNNKIFPKVTNTGWDGTLADRFLNGPNVMTQIDRRWREHRLVINPAFRRPLPYDLFADTTHRMFSELNDAHDNEFTMDVGDLLFRWSLDILGLAVFGFDFGGLSKDENNPWTSRYKQFDKDVKHPFYALFPAFDDGYRWMFPGRQAAHNNFDKFEVMLHDVIRVKNQQYLESIERNEPIEKPDLLDLMIESMYVEGVHLSYDEIFSNVCVFFAAGHDTTASALSFCLYYLAVNPEIQERARQEAIRVLCGDDQEEPMHDVLPTAEHAKEMTYINQCIKENLRLQGTVVSLVHPRVAQQDTVLMGKPIRKGTHVTVNIYDLHRNPNVWSNPSTFNPDRFAPNGEYEQQDLTTAWLPFGYGARTCIGFKFNIAEQMVLLSMILRKYTWSLPADSIHKNGVVTNNIVVMNPLDLHIQFKRRY
ncbi:cytochrome P450 [Gongronella butleri]|nr:cytochrome P450 [Gongronella butleri]